MGDLGELIKQAIGRDALVLNTPSGGRPIEGHHDETNWQGITIRLRKHSTCHVLVCAEGRLQNPNKALAISVEIIFLLTAVRR